MLKKQYVKKLCHLVLSCIFILSCLITEASYAGTVLWLKIATFELSNKNLPFIFSLPKPSQASDCTHILGAQKCFVCNVLLFLLLLISVWHAVREHEIKLCPQLCVCCIPLHLFSVFCNSRGAGGARGFVSLNDGRGVLSEPPQKERGALAPAHVFAYKLVTVFTGGKKLMEVRVCPI